jgi:hypothetical protein
MNVNGFPEKSLVPVKVGTDADWISIATDRAHAAALKGTPLAASNHITSQKKNELQIQVYPNPAAHTVYIKPVGSYALKSISLLDMTGRNIWNATGDIKEIPVSAIARGTYFLHVATDKGNMLRMVVLE